MPMITGNITEQKFITDNNGDYIYFPQYCDMCNGFVENFESRYISKCIICGHKYINNKEIFDKSRYKQGECMCHSMVRQGQLKTPEEYTIKFKEWSNKNKDEKEEV